MKFFINNRIKWADIYKNIDNIVDNCEVCLRSGDELCNSKNRVIRTEKLGDLWEVDLLGRIPTKDGKSKFIFVAVDSFAKWVETKVIESKNQQSTSMAIEELIIAKHGVPKQIYSDNGKEFTNSIITELATKHGITWKTNAPGHHNAVGGVERVNKIKKLCEFGKTSWERAVAKATLAMNLSPHRALGTCPYVMRCGENFPLTINGESTQPRVDMQKTIEDINKRRLAYDKEITAGTRSIERDMGVDTPVLIYKNPPGNKLKAKWHTGYYITGFEGKDSYLVSKGRKTYKLNKIQVKKSTQEWRRRCCEREVHLENSQKSSRIF